jgi:hypothetical protein
MIHERVCHLVLLLSVIIAHSFFPVASAYRVGEAVDTDVQIGSERLGVLRRQTPLFGKDSTAEFELHELDTFTMTFDDELWGLPSIPMITKNTKAASSSDGNSPMMLSSWTLFFVFSKSNGVGDIRKVLNDPPVYAARNVINDPTKFAVHYRWIEEPEPNVAAGQTMMMLIVIVASIAIIASSLSDEEPLDGPAAPPNGNSRSLPKLE